MKKIKHIFLACLMIASTLCSAACQTNKLKEEDVPDYSSYTHQFDFYGYHSAHDGYYSIDDVKYYVGESFLTVEQYQMYKDAGMNIFYPQSILKVRGESGAMDGDAETKAKFYNDRAADWERVKVEIDKVMSVGINRTTIYDEDLSWLSLNNYTGEGLVGDGKRFATEEELDQQVYELVSLYADYPGVYGVCLADEPKYLAVTSYGEVYNSIKRVNEKYGYNLYHDYNLNPLNLTKLVYEEYYPYVEGTGGVDPITNKVDFNDGFTRYKKYIEGYMDSLKPTAIQYDDYPLRNGYLSATYLPCMQYIASVARDRNIEFHMVAQTFEMNTNGSQSMRKLTEAGAKWLNNTMLGFGVSEISYFTYFTRSENKSNGESFYGTSSFVDLYGKKTPMYDVMQKIIANDQKFAPTVLQFKYQKSGVFTKLPLNYSGDHIQYVEDINKVTYEKVKRVSVNKECAMVNELYDAENDRYMYMAMNIVDPEYKGSPVYQTITLQFAPEYKYAAVYKDGERLLYKLKDSKLEVKGAPGEASFVIPF